MATEMSGSANGRYVAARVIGSPGIGAGHPGALRRRSATRRRMISRALARRNGAHMLPLERLLAAGGLFAVLAIVAAVFALGTLHRSYTRGLGSPADRVAAMHVGTSVALDRSGQRLYQYSDPNMGIRQPVKLSDISPYLIAATVATEDPSFFSNPGVNIQGSARAAYENLTPFGPGFGEGSGGSSITQQLVRNVYMDPDERSERSVRRKLKETFIAFELKRRYDDHQILEWYLNQIFYGNFAYGAEAAARRYFGKSARELNLAESALLAGLPQAPAEYSPALPENREKAKQRQQQVLDLMLEHAEATASIVHLSAEEIERARSEPLNYTEERFEIRALISSSTSNSRSRRCARPGCSSRRRTCRASRWSRTAA